MVIGILNFGEGLLALNYYLFCVLASLGAVQIAASHARLVGLLFWSPSISRWVGLALSAGAFSWFLTVQPDLFIPGLAGSELFVLCLLGFITAVLLSLGLGILSVRILKPRSPRLPPKRERLGWQGQSAELWLPRGSLPPLVLALREADTDSLDILSGELVAGGVAVLLCAESALDKAVEYIARQSERLNPAHRYVIGVGRGADRALGLAARDPSFHGVVALAPLGRSENARPGLRWLRETDYLTAFRATWHKPPIPAAAPPPGARIIYGDEDLLMRPALARELYPGALMVAGARHMNLASMPAVLPLVAEVCQLHLLQTTTGALPSAPISRAHGEAGE